LIPELESQAFRLIPEPVCHTQEHAHSAVTEDKSGANGCEAGPLRSVLAKPTIFFSDRTTKDTVLKQAEGKTSKDECDRMGSKFKLVLHRCKIFREFTGTTHTHPEQASFLFLPFFPNVPLSFVLVHLQMYT
jgi:hypothetical protein